MSVIWYKVWSDLWHNKIRTMLAVIRITAGVFAIGATFGMSDQLVEGMNSAHQATIPAHFTMGLTQNITEDTAHRLSKIEGVEEIALGAVFIWLLIILVISTLASILPARNATTVSVRESLAYA